MPIRLRDKRILVVDDEMELRELIGEHLQCLGATVFTAENGTRAFEIFVKERPDAVISDLRMPGGDGLFLLKSIRAWEAEKKLGRTDIYFVTGFADVDSHQLRALGGQGMISKPFHLKQLTILLSQTFKI